MITLSILFITYIVICACVQILILYPYNKHTRYDKALIILFAFEFGWFMTPIFFVYYISDIILKKFVK